MVQYTDFLVQYTDFLDYFIGPNGVKMAQMVHRFGPREEGQRGKYDEKSKSNRY